MTVAHYLVFGDLHGRILPAFRLALAWSGDHGVRVDGLLQVGDLGYFPDWTRIDRATKKHAERDPLEMGALLVASPSREADAIFGEDRCPAGLWFTPGNHEDYEALAAYEHSMGPRSPTFPVDAYLRVHCIRDGQVAELPGGIQVGALWGVDGEAGRARKKLPNRAYINWRSATALGCARFNVLLTHDSPRDTIYPDSGSEEIGAVIRSAQPALAFFGHYHGTGCEQFGDFGQTRLYHMTGFELRQRHAAEEASVGLLTWDGRAAAFTYLDPDWLRTFTRHNWKYR